jgi:hypothetical protein
VVISHQAPPASPVTCEGKVATIVGSDRADVLRRTSGDDVIAASGGNDVVLGKGGDDVVCGVAATTRCLVDTGMTS